MATSLSVRKPAEREIRELGRVSVLLSMVGSLDFILEQQVAVEAF